MPRKRIIDPAFWTDAKIVQLPFQFRLLFIGLWNLADDEGRLESNLGDISNRLFPRDEVDIETGIDYLAALGLIQVYSDGTYEEPLVQIVNFTKYQKISHATPSKLPKANKKPVSLEERRLLALRYGCKPGDKIAAQCYFCGSKGEVQWLRLYNGQPSCYVVFPGFEIDHLAPEAGGKEQGPNLVLSCRHCNRKRKDSTMVTFLEDSGKLPKTLEDSGKLPLNIIEYNIIEYNIKKGDKSPSPFVEDLKTIFTGLKLRRGYDPPAAAAEAKSAKWMLGKGYSVDQILSCCDYLKADPWWQDKPLYLMSVQKKIGEWVAQGQPVAKGAYGTVRRYTTPEELAAERGVGEVDSEDG